MEINEGNSNTLANILQGHKYSKFLLLLVASSRLLMVQASHHHRHVVCQTMSGDMVPPEFHLLLLLFHLTINVQHGYLTIHF